MHAGSLPCVDLHVCVSVCVCPWLQSPMTAPNPDPHPAPEGGMGDGMLGRWLSLILNHVRAAAKGSEIQETSEIKVASEALLQRVSGSN